MQRIKPEFFERDPATCARELIGCVFVWKGRRGMIVETEAYSAVGDEACHTWSRPSARKFVAGHPAGAAYVYLNYGVHWLFNVLVKGGTAEGFVLLRAVETEGHPKLGSGPGRLTKLLGINGSAHGSLFLGQEDTGIFLRHEAPEIVAGPRIGISRAKELPWRFGAAGSAALSARFCSSTVHSP
jgi:DNA-3-methyladenine glycosylase